MRAYGDLSSDFIVGFPGETEEDFAATMALIEEVGFDVSFSFIYSARPEPLRLHWQTAPRSRQKTTVAALAGDSA